MAGRKKISPPALGDDPLSWLGEDGEQGKPHETGKIDTGRQSTPAIPEKTVSVATEREAAGQGTVNIILDPVVTLAEVSQLKESLLGHAGAKLIEVNISKVEHIDTAGLQLLIAFSKTVKKQGGKIIWQGKSAAYSSTAELLNLTAALEMEKK